MADGKVVRYPKVLVVASASIGGGSATGITLANLFADWPRNCIAQIHDDVTPPDASLCASHFRFSSSDIALVRFAKAFLSRRPRGMASNGQRGNSAALSATNESFLGALGDIAPFSLDSELVQWVRAFKPDVIYSLLGSARVMKLVIDISDELSIKIIPHFMDDWPSVLYSKGWRNYLPRFVLKLRLKKILNRSRERLTICDDMSEVYADRYGGRFSAFMNCVDCTETSVAQSDTGLITFGYIGGLHLGRANALFDVARGLERIKAEGIPVRLEIYSPPMDLHAYAAAFRQLSVVSVMGTLPAAEVSAALLRLDVLIHVESFGSAEEKYTALSISTKVPQYMASGRPILGYGPEGISSIRYINRTRAGISVSKHADVDAIAAVCRRLCVDRALRRDLGSRGRMVAEQVHEARRVRARLLEVISRGCEI